MIASSPGGLSFAISTLGCKVNQAEELDLERSLQGIGLRRVDFSECADVYVVNSCAVTAEADAKSRRLAARARRRNPGATVVLTGCFASHTGAKVPAGVDLVVPQDEKATVGAAIVDRLGLADLGAGLESVGAVETVLGRGERHHAPAPQAGRSSPSRFGAAARQRATIKVQDGCNLFCTYCIIPFLRKRERSKRVDEVRLEVANARLAGAKEIVLTGIRLGGYRAAGGEVLEDLVESLCDAREGPAGDDFRIRLSSIDPHEITDRLLGLIAARSRLCPHLHVPMQAGNDPILRAMRRRYDASTIRERFAAAVARVPGIALTTDLIVGFPGETDTLFEETLALCEALPLADLHVFPFSPRSGTKAAGLPDRVPDADLRARAARMIALRDRKRLAWYEAAVGRTVRVITESVSSGFMRGHSAEYLPVYLETARAPGRNDWVDAVVVAARRDGVLGERAVTSGA